VVGAALLALSACEQVFGLDDYELAPGAAIAQGGAGAAGGATGLGGTGAHGGEIIPADCCIDGLAPEGWTYVQMNTTSIGEPGPACGAVADQTFSEPPGHVMGACPTCACGTPPVTCSYSLLCDNDSGCGSPTLIAPSCGAIPGGDNFCRLDAVPTPGPCAPSDTGGELPGWGRVHHLCPELETSDSMECAAGQLCADTVNARLCVMKEGETDVCPAGFETDLYVTYRSAMDTRQCSACTCGPAAGSTCGGVAFDLYSDAEFDVCFIGAQGGCLAGSSGCKKQTISTSTCASIAPLADPVYADQVGTSAPVPGTCQPSGGVASGSFQPEDPVTVCCR
jgi:hypothetical protein